MKKMMMMLLLMLSVTASELAAKPKLHFEFSGDVTIGRRSLECAKIWLCFDNFKKDINVEFGMIKKNHGLVLDEDGTLSIAVNQELVQLQDPEKFNQLNSGKIYLDSDESLNAAWLTKLGYTGTNIFKAGEYPVEKYQNYFLIKLN